MKIKWNTEASVTTFLKEKLNANNNDDNERRTARYEEQIEYSF